MPRVPGKRRHRCDRNFRQRHLAGCRARRAGQSRPRRTVAGGYLSTGDLLEINAPAEHGVMVSNPPYGERVSDHDELAAVLPAARQCAEAPLRWLELLPDQRRHPSAEAGPPDSQQEDTAVQRGAGMPSL
jgi:hypothetical protein